MRTLLSLLLFAASLSRLAAAADGPPCAPEGADAAAFAAARRVFEAACACDGFRSHAQFERCATESVGGEIRAGRLRRPCRNPLTRIIHQSTCSYRRTRTVCCDVTKAGKDRCTIRGTSKCKPLAGKRTPCGDTPYCADADCSRETGSDARCSRCPPSLLYGAEGNRLHRYDVDSIKQPPLREDILIRSAADSPTGRDINGQICGLPGGGGAFVAGEDTGQPTPPPGWGIFAADGTQIGKLSPTFQPSSDNDEPYGCAFDQEGRLFTSDVGNQATGDPTGQLLVWFPPFDRFPGPDGAYPNTNEHSTNYCKLATNIGTAGGVAVDEQGRVYVAAARDFKIHRFLPPFPTGPDAARGCGRTDGVGSPLADTVRMETFIEVPTASGIARALSGNWFVSSVFTGEIGEYSPEGTLIRKILQPPAGEPLPTFSTGNPFGLAVDCQGDLYFADLNLVGMLPDVGPGPNGKVRRITFDAAGAPSAPLIVREGLEFPDGLGILPGDLQEGQ